MVSKISIFYLKCINIFEDVSEICEKANRPAKQYLLHILDKCMKFAWQEKRHLSYMCELFVKWSERHCSANVVML